MRAQCLSRSMRVQCLSLSMRVQRLPRVRVPVPVQVQARVQGRVNVSLRARRVTMNLLPCLCWGLVAREMCVKEAGRQRSIHDCWLVLARASVCHDLTFQSVGARAGPFVGTRA